MKYKGFLRGRNVKGTLDILGESPGEYIKFQGTSLVTVAQDTPGARVEYIGLAAGEDAVCIAWVTVKQFDTTTGSSWTGDIGYGCGQDWYENAELAGYINKTADRTPENEYIPHCTWLDGDHTDDIGNAALKFRLLAYGEEVTDVPVETIACGATIYGHDTGPINGDTPQKRSVRSVPRKRKQWMEDGLVVSNVTRHRASEMCSSATSWGPDFVSEIDGYYCDMGTKTLSPLCSTEEIDGCLQVDSAEKKITKRTHLGKRAVNLAHKSYKKVELWGH